MIVKNERLVIERCLRSVKSIIDHWAIVDTGSTDGTQEIIRRCLHDIPGQIAEHPWVNFEHNRNQALDLAKNSADYLLMIDADEELVFSEPFRLDKKCIFIPVHLRNSVFKRPFLVDLTLNWRWKGAVHERIELSMPFTSACLANAYIISHEDGDRSRDMAAKFLKDAQMLEAALKKEPNNGRLVLLLAQSYSLANQLERALHTYQKRVRMGGSEEEIFYALYAVAQHERMLGRFSIESFYRAYRFRPERAEPISWIASHYLERGQFEKAYAILKEAILISYPNDMIYVEPAIYDYVLLAQLADSAWKLKKFNEAKELFLKLLANPKVPEDLKTRIQGLTKSAF